MTSPDRTFRAANFAAAALAALGLFAVARPAVATSVADAPSPAVTLRDGAHDFDFNIGVWDTRITRRLHPFTGSTETMALRGTVSVRSVWHGKAQLEEIEADGPNGHWEGGTLFLYAPQAHQWSQTFVDSSVGALSGALTGGFANGRGEFYAQDTFEGRFILVRGVWSGITPDSHSYEESYSNDGGRTWEPVFTAHLTRK